MNYNNVWAYVLIFVAGSAVSAAGVYSGAGYGRFEVAFIALLAGALFVAVFYTFNWKRMLLAYGYYGYELQNSASAREQPANSQLIGRWSSVGAVFGGSLLLFLLPRGTPLIAVVASFLGGLVAALGAAGIGFNAAVWLRWRERAA